MSSKTRIIVLHMKELIYTAIFAGLGVLLLILLWWMFSSGEHKKETVEETMYVPGVYTSTIQFNDSTVGIEVLVDENHINDISFVNLEETVSTMYPLMEPSLEAISEQIYETQSLENISCEESNQYTTEVLLSAIDDALSQGRVYSSDELSEVK